MDYSVDIYMEYLILTGQVSRMSPWWDHITRMLDKEHLDSADLWSKAKPLIRWAERSRNLGAFAVFVFDETFVEKLYTDEWASITIYWNSHKRYEQGVNLLTLLHPLNGLALPTISQLVEKTEPQLTLSLQKIKFKSEYTKNKYFQKMLSVAQQQADYSYLLADSWYASKENVNRVLDLKHRFIFALESVHMVALFKKDRKQGKFQRVNALVLPNQVSFRVLMRSVQSKLSMVRQVFTNKGPEGSSYSMASDAIISYDQTKTTYQRRRKVEECRKSLKQNASIANSRAKTPDTQANHFFAAMLTYIKFEALKLSIRHFYLKAQHYLAVLNAMHRIKFQLVSKCTIVNN